VIPLADARGNLVAELDIDSNRLAAFSPGLEQRLRTRADTFKSLI
jgi:putative methionine-R-sulfoxide reductase with GAF domain